MLELLSFIGASLISLAVLIYGLALNNIFFVIVKEGTVAAIARGGAFDHFILSFKGHYLNDPRQPWYDRNIRAWEVRKDGDPESRRSIYPRRHQLLLRLLERWRIYYYGSFPLYKPDWRPFEWSEEKQNLTTGTIEPWHRREPSFIMYIAAFTYWFKLPAAEDKGNFPLDLDYLVTMVTENPYVARYTVDDWLKRIRGDANTAAKAYVGSHSFETIRRERRTSRGGGFVNVIAALNTDLPSETQTISAPERLGIRVQGIALQEVNIVGRDAVALSQATVVKATAEMKADARRAEAQGEADAITTIADAETSRVNRLYAAIGSLQYGVQLRQLDAISDAAKSPGSTIVWANDPLMGVAGALGRLAGQQPVQGGNQQPPANPPPTTPN